MDYEKAFRDAYSRIRVSYPIIPKTGSAAVAKERLLDVVAADRSATNFPRGLTSMDLVWFALGNVKPMALLERFR